MIGVNQICAKLFGVFYSLGEWDAIPVIVSGWEREIKCEQTKVKQPGDYDLVLRKPGSYATK